MTLVILALTFAIHPVKEISSQYGEGKGIKMLSTCLSRQTCLKGNIASNRDWFKTLCLSYYLGLRYYGEKGDVSDDDVVPALLRLGVHFYFVWDESASEEARFNAFPEITDGAIPDLKIYQIAKSKTDWPAIRGEEKSCREDTEEKIAQWGRCAPSWISYRLRLTSKL